MRHNVCAISYRNQPMSYAGINTVGLQRAKFTPEKIEEITEIYRLLFIEKNTTTKALEKIESTFPSTPERDAIIGFIKTSITGIIKRPSKLANDEDTAY